MIKKYDSYKDSGIECIGQTPEHWSIKRLKNILKTKITDGPHETPIFTDEGVPFLSIDSIQDGEIIFENCRYVSLEAHNLYSKKAYVEHNDILLGKAASIGKVARVKTYNKFSIWSPLALIKPNSFTSSIFLEWVLKSNLFQFQIEQFSTSNTQKNISMDDIPKITFVTPSLPEQQQIAEYLDQQTAKIDELVQKQNKLIELLQEKKKSLINHVVTKGLNPDVQMKDSGIEWLGQIPEPWKMKKLKYLAAVRDIKQQYITGYDYIGLENIESWTGKQVLSKEEQHIDGLANLCFSGDVLFGKLRPYLAKCTIANKQSLCSTEILVLNSIKMSNKLLQYHMLSENFINDVNGSTYGTKMPRANWEYLSNLKLPLPPSNEQQQIAEYLDKQTVKIDQLINKAKSMVELLKEHKQSLINNVVTGKIKVIQ